MLAIASISSDARAHRSALRAAWGHGASGGNAVGGTGWRGHGGNLQGAALAGGGGTSAVRTVAAACRRLCFKALCAVGVSLQAGLVRRPQHWRPASAAAATAVGSNGRR